MTEVSASSTSIAEKVTAGQRLDEGEALWLFEHADLHDLGRLASVVRRRKNGDQASFLLNRYLNYSNVCILSCQFCAFAAKKKDAHAFTYSVEELCAQAAQSLEQGITEIHMVGGLHPTLGADYYLELLQGLRALDSSLHIKAFTAIEIRHLAKRVFKQSIADTLSALREAGLNSLTGGGAEIFDTEVRDRICRGKETAEQWCEVHRLWHQLGGRSTCTMLYGHVETLAQRVEHLQILRQLQDETGGFTGFVALPFVPETTELAHIRPVGALEQLRVLAVSRLYLDNIDHITAYWVGMGLPLAQVALHYGVDDLHGTIVEEKIFHMAGARTPQEQTVAALQRAIVEAGFTPVQRDSHYEIIEPVAMA